MILNKFYLEIIYHHFSRATLSERKPILDTTIEALMTKHASNVTVELILNASVMR